MYPCENLLFLEWTS